MKTEPKKLSLLQMKKHLRSLEYTFAENDIDRILRLAKKEGFVYRDLGFEEVSDQPIN